MALALKHWWQNLEVFLTGLSVAGTQTPTHTCRSKGCVPNTFTQPGFIECILWAGSVLSILPLFAHLFLTTTLQGRCYSHSRMRTLLLKEASNSLSVK